VISQPQRHLPNNKQHSQQTDNQAPWVIRTSNHSTQAAADQFLRLRGHWNGLPTCWLVYLFMYFTYLIHLINLFILAYVLFCLQLTYILLVFFSFSSRLCVYLVHVFMLRMYSVNPCSVYSSIYWYILCISPKL
jgi:hypothetical protein